MAGKHLDIGAVEITGINFLLAAATIITDISEEKPEYILTDISYFVQVQVNENEDHCNEMHNLEQDLEFWNYDVLRISTLDIGDYVRVQMGIAVQKISEDEAKEALMGWEGEI